VKIFETMKPVEAARIFEQMDMPVLLDIIERMKERNAAPVLAQMHPARAKQVTGELAKRRQPASAAGGPSG
jgi:flagellar motility protein MotE (MotC chaperone)